MLGFYCNIQKLAEFLGGLAKFKEMFGILDNYQKVIGQNKVSLNINSKLQVFKTKKWLLYS